MNNNSVSARASILTKHLHKELEGSRQSRIAECLTRFLRSGSGRLLKKSLRFFLQHAPFGSCLCNVPEDFGCAAETIGGCKSPKFESEYACDAKTTRPWGSLLNNLFPAILQSLKGHQATNRANQFLPSIPNRLSSDGTEGNSSACPELAIFKHVFRFVQTNRVVLGKILISEARQNTFTRARIAETKIKS